MCGIIIGFTVAKACAVFPFHGLKWIENDFEALNSPYFVILKILDLFFSNTFRFVEEESINNYEMEKGKEVFLLTSDPFS